MRFRNATSRVAEVITDCNTEFVMRAPLVLLRAMQRWPRSADLQCAMAVVWRVQDLQDRGFIALVAALG